MTNYYSKIAQYFLPLAFGAGLLCPLGSCNQPSHLDPGLNSRSAFTINLFPPESIVYDNSGKLNFDTAFAQSEVVLQVATIKKIDSMDSRRATPLYIYEVKEGLFLKPIHTSKNLFPLRFMAHKAFFKGPSTHQSAYLFLTQMHDFKMLQAHVKVTFQWLNNAPYIMP